MTLSSGSGVSVVLLMMGLGFGGLLTSCGESEALGGTGGAAPASMGGSGGASGGNPAAGGVAGFAQPVPCGDTVCMPLTVLPQVPPVPACCADASQSQCGLGTEVLDFIGATPTSLCEPFDQPGELDPECPPSPEQVVFDQTITFPGCCRAETGTCGYMLNTVFGIINVGLGCVDSTPLLAGETPASCDLND